MNPVKITNIKSTCRKGFHLIEILFVIAILSIIAAFCFPLYSEYLLKARRQEAASMLEALALAMESYQLENNSYEDASLAKLHFSEWIAKNNYRLIIKKAAKQDYFLIAEPSNRQAANDAACRSLTLRASGEKGITGSGKVDECW